MKKLLVVSSFAALCVISPLAHADFNTELGGAAVRQDYDKNLGFENDQLNLYALGGSYYFSTVNTRKGPLAEANFLDKQSSFDVAFLRSDAGSFNANAWMLGGTYVLQGSGLYLNAAVNHINGLSSENYSFGGGYYLSKDWSISVDTNFSDDMDFNSATLSSKKLFDLGSDYFVSVEGSYINYDMGDDNFAVFSDFYLNRNFSLGLGYEWPAGHIDHGTKTLRSQWFINDNVALNGEISSSDSGVIKTYTIGATMRF